MYNLKLKTKTIKCSPIEDLLKTSKILKIPGVYENIKPNINPKLNFLFFILGGSGFGKDAILEPAINKNLLTIIPTCTNREIRPGEREESYTWMRQQRQDESEKDYLDSMIKEYDLIEYDFHHNNLYGLSKKNLMTATERRASLIRTDTAGFKTIRNVMKDKVNMITIFIVPDSYEQVWKRIQGRGNEEERMETSIGYAVEAPNFTNYYLHNTEYPGQYRRDYSKNGLVLAQNSFKELVRMYI